MGLKGKQAIDFSLPDENGKLVSLQDYKGKKLLLVFYPGDNTAVCTKQLCSYSSGFDGFKNLKIEILGISMDSVESHKKFREKFKLSFPLLADLNGKVCEAYNAKGFFVVKRSTFLIDENQIIQFENEVLPIFFKDKDEILDSIKKIIL